MTRWDGTREFRVPVTVQSPGRQRDSGAGECMKMKLPQWIRMTGALAVAVIVTACATPANVDYRQGYDFSAVREVRIVPPERPGSGDPRVDSPLVDARIRKAIGDHLTAHGIGVVTDDPDADVAYQIGTRTGMESYDSGLTVGVGTFHGNSAFGVGYGFPAYDLDSYQEVVLTIDILGVPGGALLWRGSGSRRLVDGSTPESTTRLFNELVDDILDHFPPGDR